MTTITRHRQHQLAARQRRQARPFPGRARCPAISPRVVLHLLVGALTIVSAQALIEPLSRSWEKATSTTSVVYAEQQSASPAVVVPTLGASPQTPPPSVAAPALSTGPEAPSQPIQQDAGRSNVMTDLRETFGRTDVPAITTWQGVAGADVNRRSTPDRSGPPVGELKAGTPVEVVRWVMGEEIEPHNTTWAELSDGTFVYSTALRRTGAVTPPALPADAPTEGRWIDINLSEQVATAYDGQTPLRSALISTGRPGWETPVGVFSVQRRLEKDTMDGATLVGQGPNGEGASYKVEDVRYVQYFTSDGAAIHENYWRRPATFGMPGSHGCIGMVPADAAWFWDFATVGTPLVIHE